MAIVENLLATVENVLLILLFSLYLLLGNGTSIPGGPSDKVGAQINSQIRSFIKGKVLLSLLVGFLTGFLLWTLRVDLWLCFGVLAFWLNFIPNVGKYHRARPPAPSPLPLAVTRTSKLEHAGCARVSTHFLIHPPFRPPLRSRALACATALVCAPGAICCRDDAGALIAVAAPMPLVLFTPSFGLGKMMLSLMLPLLVHVVVGNVLEPVVFGRAMELQPVIVLLSLMVWGTLWGVPGLVLAVPLTAVLKIHLSYVDHPLPRLLLRVLEGEPRNRNAQGSSGGSSGGGNHQPGPMKHSDSEPDEDQELLPDLGISHAHHFPSRLSTTPPPASLEGISIDGNQQRMENACLVAGLDVEQPRGSRTR